MKRVAQVLIFLFAITVAWMTYDNVLSDDAPFKQLAEDAACLKKKCTEKHGLTAMSRTPIGVTIETTWKDGSITTTCRREYFVVGVRKCTVD
ncbi:hypothetical protein BH09MYX1_BH09MYX1_48340 [soil metagenome]